MVVEGYCPIHHAMSAQELKDLKQAHPQAMLLVHPECREEIRRIADYIGSTSGIIKYATESQNTEFIIGTEVGVRYDLQRKNPGKKFYFPRTTPICADMKKITLDKIIHVLKTGENSISVPEELAGCSKLPLERMLELSR